MKRLLAAALLLALLVPFCGEARADTYSMDTFRYEVPDGWFEIDVTSGEGNEKIYYGHADGSLDGGALRISETSADRQALRQTTAMDYLEGSFEAQESGAAYPELFSHEASAINGYPARIGTIGMQTPEGVHKADRLEILAGYVSVAIVSIYPGDERVQKEILLKCAESVAFYASTPGIPHTPSYADYTAMINRGQAEGPHWTEKYAYANYEDFRASVDEEPDEALIAVEGRIVDMGENKQTDWWLLEQEGGKYWGLLMPTENAHDVGIGDYILAYGMYLGAAYEDSDMPAIMLTRFCQVNLITLHGMPIASVYENE